MLDQADSSIRGRWGVDAVALDASNPDKVYAALGMYTNSW
jgi:xyloglucan-specific exo-beta-1,4-glucanase